MKRIDNGDKVAQIQIKPEWCMISDVFKPALDDDADRSIRREL